MNTLPVYHGGGHHRYLQSWVLSVLFHAVVVGAAITLVSDLHVAPQPEPFRWEVSVAEAPVPAQVEKPRPTAVEPTSTAAQPVEPEVVTKPVQQVVPVETTEPAPVSDAPPAVREPEAPATPALSAEAVPDSPPQPTVVARRVVEATRPAVHEIGRAHV